MRTRWLVFGLTTALSLSFAFACSTSDPDAPPALGNVDVADGSSGMGAGAECTVGTECKSGMCIASRCTAPDAARGCTGPSECESKICVASVCQPAKPDDGVKNADETDVDCGGTAPGAARCADTKGCKAGTDCTSGVCDPAAFTCSAPTSNDGVKNADETDVDCGGTLTGASKCGTGQGCKLHEDCTSDGCDDTLHCANGRSCTQQNGGRTCGSGEFGAAGAKHESCCGAIAIPGSATKLDKYKITAGRMRAFVERTKGNVRGWYDANVASLTAAQTAQIEPFKSYLPTDLLSYPYGANYQLGGTIYLPTQPSNVQGCFTGNAGNQANGAHTYWNGALEQEDRGFDQAFLDRLPLNCVTFPMVAAFCAWDGGRVETYAEHDTAYGADPYPYGSAPGAGGYVSLNNVWTLYGPGAALQAAQGPCPTCDPNRVNWQHSYQFPTGGNPMKPWDYVYWISAPGRFPLGANAVGHQDLAGLMMELTATITTNDTVPDLNGQSVTQPKVRWSKNGSWEGHRVGQTGFEFAIMTKYGKTGGRCARD